MSGEQLRISGWRQVPMSYDRDATLGKTCNFYNEERTPAGAWAICAIDAPSGFKSIYRDDFYDFVAELSAF